MAVISTEAEAGDLIRLEFLGTLLSFVGPGCNPIGMGLGALGSGAIKGRESAGTVITYGNGQGDCATGTNLPRTSSL